MKCSVLVLFLLLSSLVSLAQQVTVTGRVIDDKSTGMSGATIMVKGGKTATTTDGDGSFSIKVPSRSSVLVISNIGYATQEVTADAKGVANALLVPDTKGLGEVVVVGYGNQAKKVITGAVQTVSEKELRDIPVSQISQKLQGRLAGVQINQATGKPGQGMSVRIRGQLSVSAGSDPLYVIDGFPITGNIGSLNP